MKVKIKISLNQFKHLLTYVQSTNYLFLNELQVLNIRLFLPFALKKLIDSQSDAIYNVNKDKTFSIEVNQYVAIMALLEHDKDNLEPYMLATYIMMQSQNRNLLILN